MENNPKSLYVHIPFCSHICEYCDFTKLFYNQKFIEPYLKALFSEIDSYNIDKYDTIYVGGGTPTSLCDDDFEILLKKLKPLLNENGEFSVEANVENLSLEKLLIMKKYGVNRLSIGVESTNDKRLKEIGRHHSFLDAVKAVNLAKENGFNNINVDLIYGFKGETIFDLKDDLKNILALETSHISIYSLIIEKGSMLFNKGYKEQNEDDSRLYYETILKTLRENGYTRYEVSNFAKEGKYSRHNLTYWKDNEYVGVGLGASGYVHNVRYTNTKNLSKYISGEFIAEQEFIDKNKELEDYLLCNLRLEEGFSRKDFLLRFNEDFVDMFSSKLVSLTKSNLLLIYDDKIKLTDEGILLLDFVLEKLL